MLGVVTLGDAARYGLPVAALQAKKGAYVEPTDKSMAAALKLSKQATKLKPFELDQADVRKSTTAYPGTMVVYTAAKTYGLDKAAAGRVAQFIQVSTTEGQTAGRGNGKLPDGYLPIAATGATAALYRSAQEVRTAVLAQKKPSSGATDAPDPTRRAGRRRRRWPCRSRRGRCRRPPFRPPRAPPRRRPHRRPPGRSRPLTPPRQLLDGRRAAALPPRGCGAGGDRRRRHAR